MLYLTGIIISSFLALVMATKKNKSSADYILMAWMIIFGFHLLSFYYIFTNQQFDFPIIVGLGTALPLVHGPFLYLYTYQQTSAQPFNKKLLLHFLPFFLANLLFVKFYFLTHLQQAEVFHQNGKGFEMQSLIKLYAIYISGIVYVTISILRLVRYRRKMVQQFSNTERINFNWLLYLIIWMVIIWIVVLFVQRDDLIYGAASLFVLWIGYFGIRQVQVFTPHHEFSEFQKENEITTNQKAEENKDANEPANPLKYQKSALSEEEANRVHEHLLKLMNDQQPYKDPELTLDDLATKLDVHPNYLSQVINSMERKSFYDLVNEKRVDAFIESISQPSSQQYTMLAIALDCGFNSKASFNRNFKKYTGQTPSEYVRVQHVLPPYPPTP